MKLQQRGFGMVESLLLIGVLLVIGAIGYAVYNTSPANTKSNVGKSQVDTVKQQPQAKPAASPTEGSLELPEMGVKIQKSAILKNAVYSNLHDSTPERYRTAENKRAYFLSTTELVAALEACNPGLQLDDYRKSALGVGSGDGIYPTDRDDHGYGTLLKQFDSSFVSYKLTANNGCIKSSSADLANKAEKLLAQVREAYIAAFKDAELLEQ